MDSIILHIKSNAAQNGTAVRTFFAGLRDGKYELIAKRVGKRTLPQNAYLHLVFTMLVQPLRDAGWDNIREMEDAKEFIKELFLKVTVRNEKTGEETKRIRHTSELTTIEMMQFIDEIQRWASEYLSFYVPDPGEYVQMFQNTTA